MNHSEHIVWAVILFIFAILELLATPIEIQEHKENAKMKLDGLRRKEPEPFERTQLQKDIEEVEEEAQTGNARFYWLYSVITSLLFLGLAVRLIMTA